MVVKFADAEFRRFVLEMLKLFIFLMIMVTSFTTLRNSSCGKAILSLFIVIHILNFGPLGR